MNFSTYNFSCPTCKARRGAACVPFYPNEKTGDAVFLDRPHLARMSLIGASAWSPVPHDELGQQLYALQLLRRLVRETRAALAEAERRAPAAERCPCHQAQAHRCGVHHRVTVTGNLVRAAAKLLAARRRAS